MCAFANEVRTLVDEKVINGEHFTAFDITIGLRKQKPSMNIKHNEVRGVVHDMYRDGEMDSYRSTQVKFPSAPRTAALFHPSDFDVDAFIDALQTGQNTSQATSQITSQTTNQNSSNPVVSVSTDVRIYVPKIICKQAGFDANEEGFAEVDNNKNIVIRKLRSGEEPNCSVDCKGNLRVRKETIFQVTRSQNTTGFADFEVFLGKNSSIVLIRK